MKCPLFENLITSMSKFENIVYLHDYVYLDKSWYEGFLKYGNNFEVVVNRIINFKIKIPRLAFMERQQCEYR